MKRHGGTQYTMQPPSLKTIAELALRRRGKDGRVLSNSYPVLGRLLFVPNATESACPALAWSPISVPGMDVETIHYSLNAKNAA